MANRVDAQIDSYIMEIETIDDSMSMAIAKHEYPFVDGADLQNMGARAGTTRFRCHFFGDTYEDHYGFIEHVRQAGDEPLELTHPVYGTVKGKVENLGIHHDDGEEAAIDIEFVAQGRDQLEVQSVADITTACEAAFQAGQTEQIATAKADILSSLGENAGALLDTVLDPALSVVGQIVGVSMQGRKMLLAIDTALGQADAIMSSVTIPVSAIVSIVDYGTTLPGRIVGTFSRAAARVVQSLVDVKDSPSLISSLRSTFDSWDAIFNDDEFPALRHARIAASQALAVAASQAYSTDEVLRGAYRRSEGLESFDALGRRLSVPSPVAVMTINDLESTLNMVLQYLSTTFSLQAQSGSGMVDAARDMTSLRLLAAALVSHVQEIKLEREKIVTRVIKSEMPLHLVCMQAGLSHSYAERVLSINPKIKYPSYVIGEVRVYAK